MKERRPAASSRARKYSTQAWCSALFPEVNAETEHVSRLSKPDNYLQKNKKREKNAGAGVYTDSWKWSLGGKRGEEVY